MPEDGRRSVVARGWVKVRVMNEGRGVHASHISMADSGSPVYISDPWLLYQDHGGVEEEKHQKYLGAGLMVVCSSLL
jgi:hypothetical protein